MARAKNLKHARHMINKLITKKEDEILQIEKELLYAKGQLNAYQEQLAELPEVTNCDQRD